VEEVEVEVDDDDEEEEVEDGLLLFCLVLSIELEDWDISFILPEEGWRVNILDPN
jgi:hypothetical protein